MPNSAACKTCLVVGIRMYDLRNSHTLRELLEKLTCTKLYSEDARTEVCYICYSQLQRCHRFVSMATKAEKILKQGISVNNETLEPVSTIQHLNNFIVTPIEAMTLPVYTDKTLVAVKVEAVETEPSGVKEEIIDDVDIKVEAISGQDEDVGMLLPELNDFESRENTDSAFNEYGSEYGKILSSQQCLKIPVSDKHICKLCKKEYSSQHSLKRHTIWVHEQPMQYECDYCNKYFSKKCMLLKHILCHMDLKQQADKKNTYKYRSMKCHLCTKVLADMSSLRKHIASHSKEKSVVCEFCPKRFTHKSLLLQHVKIHTGEKPYGCDLCDKRFTQSGHAISHKRFHYRIKPFTCEVCAKSFAEKSTLTKHMRTHTGDKPYKCVICHKTFTRRDSMKCHMNAH